MMRQGWLWSSVVSVGLVMTLVAQVAQEPSGPRFEVASIKKRDRSARPAPLRTLPQSAVFNWESTSVASLIYFAHNILDFELAGGPDWIREDLFEINARAAGEASIDERRRMVQSLLEDRFRLVLHKEQREMRVSRLVLARNDGRLGSELTKCGDPSVKSTPLVWPRGGSVSVLPCAPISAIADLASRIMRMRVVDKTGLPGMWRHELVFADPNISVP